MKLLDGFTSQFNESGRASFVRSNRHGEIGVGLNWLGMILALALGIIVARPGISFGEVLGVFGDLGGMAMDYGKLAFIPIVFWLLSCLARPFAHAKSTQSSFNALAWKLFGVALLAGVTAPLWLWASFRLGNPITDKVTSLAAEWLGMNSFSSNRLMIVAIMAGVMYIGLFYAMVQLGGTAHAKMIKAMPKPAFSEHDFVTQPLRLKVWLTQFKYFVGRKLTAWDMSRQASKTMNNAAKEAKRAAKAASAPLHDDEDGFRDLDELFERSERSPAARPQVVPSRVIS